MAFAATDEVSYKERVNELLLFGLWFGGKKTQTELVSETIYANHEHALLGRE